MTLRKYIVLTETGGLVGDAEDLNTASVLADASALDGNVNTYVVSAVSGIHTPRGFAKDDPKEAAIRADAKIVVAAAKKAVQAAVTKALKPASADAKAEREKELNAMTAGEVRAIAATAGVEHSTKAENVDAILAVEFP